MSVEVDTTQWSLPGPADMPRDTLQMQLEVYKETILLRGFENDSTWVRTVSADAIDLTELAEVTVFGSVPAVERDLYWAPQTLGEIRRQASGMAA